MTEAARLSWGAWLLDAFANSIAPSPTEEDFSDEHIHVSDHARATIDDNITHTRPHTLTHTHDCVNMSSSSSPYGPYVRTGRGGAGNFTWQPQSQSQVPTSKSERDLESQNTTTLSERRKVAATIEHLDTQAAVFQSQMQARNVSNGTQYVRVGRGGAGNAYAPTAPSNEHLHSPGSGSGSVNFTPRSSSSTFSPPASPAIHATGRGGAGNYAAALAARESTESVKDREERLAAEQRREKAEQEVESTLQPPSQAWLGGRRKSGSFASDDVELSQWN